MSTSYRYVVSFCAFTCVLCAFQVINACFTSLANRAAREVFIVVNLLQNYVVITISHFISMHMCTFEPQPFEVHLFSGSCYYQVEFCDILSNIYIYI